MATCANCNSPMITARLIGVGYDSCPQCGSVFIAPVDASSQGVDIGVLFGGGPGSGNLNGPSTRVCPHHGGPMSSYRVVAPTGALTIERSDCCGGVFLDPGEDTPLLAAAQRAARLAQAAAADASAGDFVVTASGARFAAPPPRNAPGGKEASGGGAFGNALQGLSRMGGPAQSLAHIRRLEATQPSEQSCPRCHAQCRRDEAEGIAIELCPECGSMFLDAQDAKAKSLSTALLFGVSPHAAQERGPSELACPRCGDQMTIFEVPYISGPIEVDRATCCGGLFLDGGEYEPFVRASRAAQNRAADAHYAQNGSYVGEAHLAAATSAGNTEVLQGQLKRAVDSMVARSVAREAARQYRHDSFDDFGD